MLSDYYLHLPINLILCLFWSEAHHRIWCSHLAAAQAVKSDGNIPYVAAPIHLEENVLSAFTTAVLFCVYLLSQIHE